MRTLPIVYQLISSSRCFEFSSAQTIFEMRPENRLQLGSCTLFNTTTEAMTRAIEPNALDLAGIERAMGWLRERVKSAGLKGSLVRDAVARAALEQPGHFTADDLIRDLREKGCQYAHTSTIYRTLPLLVRLRLLRTTLVTLGEHTRYERAFEREPHEHLVCMHCQAVVEFSSSSVDAAQRDVASKHGFAVVGRVFEVYGVCSDCRPTITALWKDASRF